MFVGPSGSWNTARGTLPPISIAVERPPSLRKSNYHPKRESDRRSLSVVGYCETKNAYVRMLYLAGKAIVVLVAGSIWRWNPFERWDDGVEVGANVIVRQEEQRAIPGRSGSQGFVDVCGPSASQIAGNSQSLNWGGVGDAI